MDYKEIIKKGERVDWYGDQVPQELITSSVRTWCEVLLNQIDTLESELNDLKGNEREKRKNTINLLLNNVKKSPYRLNGDFYLIKKKRYEAELKQEEESKKSKKKVEKTPKTKKVTSTKNSDLIFGKNK